MEALIGLGKGPREGGCSRVRQDRGRSPGVGIYRHGQRRPPGLHPPPSKCALNFSPDPPSLGSAR